MRLVHRIYCWFRRWDTRVLRWRDDRPVDPYAAALHVADRRRDAAPWGVNAQQRPVQALSPDTRACRELEWWR